MQKFRHNIENPLSMLITEELAKHFIQSQLFSPASFDFLKVIGRYIQDKDISLAFLANEIRLREQVEGFSISIQTEEQFLATVIPKILAEVEARIAAGEIDDNTVRNYWRYAEILPFQDQHFLAVLLAVLFDIQQCFELYWMLEKAKPLQVPSSLKKLYSKKDDLIDVTHFDVLQKGFVLKNHDLVIYPRLSIQLSLQILSFARQNQGKSSLKVRPRHVGQYSTYSNVQRIQEERIFGMPFSKQNLRQLIKKEYGVLQYCFENDIDETTSEMFDVPLKELQYVIKPMPDGYVTISIEEVMDIEKERYHKYRQYRHLCNDGFYMLQRFAHAIIDQETLAINHFDFSYMFYDFDDYANRVVAHMKDKVVSATIKKKLFRIDGIVPFDIFKKILAACFEHNPEIVNLLKDANL